MKLIINEFNKLTNDAIKVIYENVNFSITNKLDSNYQIQQPPSDPFAITDQMTIPKYEWRFSSIGTEMYLMIFDHYEIYNDYDDFGHDDDYDDFLNSFS